MVVFSAFRDFADGLTRGFSLFFTERREVISAASTQSRQPVRRPR